jgi:hypothetical protein
MAWGAMGPGFKSQLIIFDESVNAQSYFKALKRSFIPVANESYGASQWVHVKDGASPHTTDSNIVKLTKRPGLSVIAAE